MIALFDYNKYNLIMESSFEFKGYDFLYFDEGVPFYTLFRTSRKLNSFWEVKYVAEILLYLNPEINNDLYISLILELSDRSSGHVIRTYSKQRVKDICYLLLSENPIPYVRRYRKVIFNPFRMIPTEDKMYIVGKIIGSRTRKKKITTQQIYNAFEKLATSTKLITKTALAKELKCARQTVSNNITSDLKDVIDYHNNLFRF